MTSIRHPAVSIQTTPQSVPSTPAWFGEVTILAHYLKHTKVLEAVAEKVRFARARLGHYDTIDFVAVRLRSAISGERTLEAFYKRVQPFAREFMALFGRARLHHRSTLSRFLQALEPEPVEALRDVFRKDVLALAAWPTRVIRRMVGPAGQPVAGLRCGWDATGGPPTRLTSHRRASSSQATDGQGLRSRPLRTQARGVRPHAHDRAAGPSLAMARLMWN